MKNLLTQEGVPVSDEGRSHATTLYMIWAHLARNPMGIVWRFISASFFGFLAMAIHLYAVQDKEAIPTVSIWGNILAMGLLFGHAYALTVVLASEYPSRLRPIWPTWTRALLSGILGVIFAALTWAVLFMRIAEPQWSVLILGGAGLAAGLVIAETFRLPAIASMVITAVASYLPIYFVFQAWNVRDATTMTLLGYWQEEQIYTIAIPFVTLLAVGAFLPQLLRELRRKS